jgi:hypothetical protein
MADQSNLPPLKEYPGYFATKPPFLKRKRVQVVAAGAAGLLLGVALGGGSASSTPAVEEVSEGQVQTRIAAAVDDAVSKALEASDANAASDRDDVQEALASTESTLEATESRLSSTKRKLADAKRDVRLVRANAKITQRKAVAAAVARTKTQMQAQAQATAPRSLTGEGSGSATDPRFDWCYEANDAGYGNYQRGVDSEYDWYDDADNDGWVCEF